MKKRSCYGIIIISFVQIFVYTMAYLAIGNFSRKEFIVIRREKMARFAIYLEVDSNVININAPDKLR